jgi:MFS family permease
MFVVSRALIGFGATLSMVAAAAYAAETLPVSRRGWGVGLLGDLYYVGAFISAGVTYGTARMQSTWAWRIPSAVQGVFSLVAILVLLVVPESPRWLAMNGREDEALAVVALMHADGDEDHPETLSAWQEIRKGIALEKLEGAKQATIGQIFSDKDLRMRLLLVVSASVCAMLSGNNIVSFYLGDMLDKAGITDSNTQLEIVRCKGFLLLSPRRAL